MKIPKDRPTKKYDHGGGGRVVSLLAYYSDNPSLNPAEAYNLFRFSCLKRKRGRGLPIATKSSQTDLLLFKSRRTILDNPLRMR